MEHETKQIYIKPEISTIAVHSNAENDGIVSHSNTINNNVDQEIKYEAQHSPHPSFLYIDVKVESNSEHLNQDPESVFGMQNYNDLPSELVQMENITEKVYENGCVNRIACPKCDKDFKNRANLKNHLKYVHATEDSSVECSQCYRTFKSKAHLRTHINSIHVEDKEVQCTDCQRTFLNKKKLSNHMFFAHPRPGQIASCEICKKDYKSSYNLKVHIRQVHPPNNKAATCEQCKKAFKNEFLLQRHIKWSHSPDGLVYRCQKCGRTLPSILCYRKHMENVHSNSEYTCNVCSRTFKSSKSLERHEINIHSIKTEPETTETEETVKVEISESKQCYRVGTLKCPECDKYFVTTTAVDWHYERYHSDNKLQTICLICSKELSDHASVKRHMEMCHSLETASCHICHKEFKSYLNLQRHIKVTHAPPEAETICEICNKTFKCAMHLRIHTNAVHSKDGTFSCDLCGKEFSSKKYMVKHRKTHIATKDYPCPLCDKYFKSLSDVTKHKKRVHVSITDFVEVTQDDDTS